MAVRISKPAFNIRDKLTEIGANISTNQMPSGTIIHTAYSEYSTQVTIGTAGRQKYATVWTPHIVAKQSGSDFLVMANIQGYWLATANGVNLGIQRVIDNAWITLADEQRNVDGYQEDQWMGMGHNQGNVTGSFNIGRFAMDTYRNYKAGQKIQWDIAAGFWNNAAGEIRINYSGYQSQCVAFIMEIRQ
tara:strand:- start:236 stop:802 length:567 start_codon:yes stop_codon:yes gene_type:complete